MRSVTIVGAGVAGLTAACVLARQGHAVTVVDRDEAPGGLARSFHYGDFHFDIGPHRFHTENARVAAFIRDVLAEDAVEIPRKSAVRMFGGFHQWPLRPSVLLSMPFSMMVGGARNLVFRSHLEGESFEADVINKYGRTLYDVFFKPYTEKFLFRAPALLHRDWARAGVNRAIIDQRVKADTLWTVLRGTLLPKPAEMTFLYPPTGVGRYSERLVREIHALGGHVRLSEPVVQIESSERRVAAVSTPAGRLASDFVLWTAPITSLCRLLSAAQPRLPFLSTIFYNIELKQPTTLDYQWIYYGGDEVFSRVSIPAVFSPTMTPAGRGSLCVEVTCIEGDARWRDPGQFTAAVVADLVRTETIPDVSVVGRVHIECVRDTYPVYTVDYPNELKRALRMLERYGNLVLAGRCGRFWYNNMDHSIGQALTVADRIDGGAGARQEDLADREFWHEHEADVKPIATR